jgi:competence ComEA-like helix-hairpin-helix protein
MPLPVRRYDLNKASLAELERLPGVGFIMAQKIVDYRETHGPFASLESLQAVPGFSPAMLEDLKDSLYVDLPVTVAKDLPPESLSPGLGQARNVLNQGILESAIEEYEHLIKTRQDLPEIIQDLHAAAQRYPGESAIWQCLGDAYLRSDQIQAALDAYSKAEELLQ